MGLFLFGTMVASANNSVHELTGTWQSICHERYGDASEKYEFRFNSKAQVRFSAWRWNNKSCSGTPSQEEIAPGRFTTGNKLESGATELDLSTDGDGSTEITYGVYEVRGSDLFLSVFDYRKEMRPTQINPKFKLSRTR